MFVRLRPFDERPGEEHSAMAVIQRAVPAVQRHHAARWSLPFLPPPIQGIGRFGGFQFEVLDDSGGRIERPRHARRSAIVARATARPA